MGAVVKLPCLQRDVLQRREVVQLAQKNRKFEGWSLTIPRIEQ